MKALQLIGKWLLKQWKAVLGVIAGIGLLLAITRKDDKFKPDPAKIKQTVNAQTQQRVETAETQHGAAVERVEAQVAQEAEVVRERGPEATEQWLNDMDRKIRMDRMNRGEP